MAVTVTDEEYAAVFGMAPKKTAIEEEAFTTLPPEPATLESFVPDALSGADAVTAKAVEDEAAQNLVREEQARQEHNAAVQAQPGFDPRIGQVRQPLTVRGRGTNVGVNDAAVDQRAASQVAEIMQARREQDAATVAQVEADREENQQKAVNLAAEAEFERQSQLEIDAIQKQHAERAQQRIGQFEEAVNKAASLSIAPGRLWNTSTGTQLNGAFSAFIGGFLGNPNIQAIIDKGIDRDINSQREAKDSALKQVDHFKELHLLASDEEDSVVTNKLAQRVARRASLIKEFESSIALMQDPKIVAKGMKVLADNKTLMAQEKADFAKDSYAIAERKAAKEQVAIERAAARAAQVRAAKIKAAADKKALEEKRAHEVEVAEAKAGGETSEANKLAQTTSPYTGKPYMVTDKDGNQKPAQLQAWVVKNPSAREKFENKKEGSYEAAKALKEIIELQEEYGPLFQGPLKEILLSTEGKRLQQAYVALVNAEMKAQSGLVISIPETERKKVEIPLNTFMSRNNKEALEAKLDQVADKARMNFNTHLDPESAEAAYKDLKTRTEKPLKGKSAKEVILHLGNSANEKIASPGPDEQLDAVKAFELELKQNPSAAFLPGVERKLEEAKAIIEEKGTDTQKMVFKRKHARAMGIVNKALGKTKSSHPGFTDNTGVNNPGHSNYIRPSSGRGF